MNQKLMNVNYTMSETTLRPFEFRISYVHDDGCHVVGLKRLERQVVFLSVANAEKSCIGEKVSISGAKINQIEDCPPKFYRAYGITDPYEYGWTFLKLIPESVTFGQKPPFTPIPLAKSEVRVNKLDSVTIGSVWSYKQKTFVIKEMCIEKFCGKERMRVWVTDENGKRGQAMYADSITETYTRVR